MTPTIRFLPGDVPTVASDAVVAVIAAHPQDPLVAAVADAVARGGGADAVLAAVQANAWPGLPDFCLCEPRDGGFRLVFRGAFEIRPDGEPVIAALVEPWADGTVTNDAVTLRYLPSVPSAASVTPYPGGLVYATIVRVATGEAAELMLRAQAAPAPSPVLAPQPLPASAPSAPPVPSSAASAPPVPSSAASAPPVPSSAASAPPVPSSAASARSSGSPAAWVPESAVLPLPPVPPVPPAPPVLPAPPVPAVAAPAPAGASLDETMVVSADWMSHEAPRVTAQTVLAGRCPSGHLTPAFAPECRVCHAPLPPQQPVEVPGPDLGALRLSTGATVRLDRGAVIGRRPTAPAGAAGEEPQLVVVQSPDGAVSAQHLEVVVEYWTVGVRDLGSTNGTELTQPGRPPMRLRPHELVILEPGAHVNLAGSTSFVFDPAS